MPVTIADLAEQEFYRGKKFRLLELGSKQEPDIPNCRDPRLSSKGLNAELCRWELLRDNTIETSQFIALFQD